MTGRLIQRNYGIDCLRVVAMLFIITIHTLRHGGILNNVEVGSLQYNLSYLLLTIVNCGVDIFAIISGYVGYTEYKKAQKWNKFIYLWLVVVFYGVVLSVLFYMFGFVEKSSVFQAFFPICNNVYWYFTAYLFVFLLSPFLNEIIRESNANIIIGGLIIGALLMYGSHALEGCFSFCLLLYLYYVGGVLRKYKVEKVFSIKICVICILCLVLMSWLWRIVFSTILLENIAGILIRYDSPVLITMSMFWVMLFAKIKIQINLVQFIKPSIFSVYILNDNPLVRQFVIRNLFQPFSNAVLLMIKIIVFSFFFFGIAILIDFVRRGLFCLLRVDSLVDSGIQRFNVMTNKLLYYFRYWFKV